MQGPPDIKLYFFMHFLLLHRLSKPISFTVTKKKINASVPDFNLEAMTLFLLVSLS